MNCCNCKSKYFGLALLFVGVLLVLPGCNAALKNAPHIGFGRLDIQAEIGRDDIVVLDRVEGSSTRSEYLFGIIQIIDGDKLQLFGIKFFKDKLVPLWGAVPGYMGTGERAYYDALEGHPDADAVLSKSWEWEQAGIPLLFYNETVTFKGKAVRLKADQ